MTVSGFRAILYTVVAIASLALIWFGASSNKNQAGIVLEFRDLSEPTQGALYFFLFHLMPTGEGLKTHVLESGSLQ
jgi:hypothetical protein